jgi:CheY-like chemotaxis protein
MISMLRRSLGETIVVETDYSPDLWQTLVDLGQLENALLNLAINARDAMPLGGELTIKTANWRRGDESPIQLDDGAAEEGVLLAVSDTGSGMAPDVQERIFEPFFTTKEVGQRSGLGLSMVFGFVAQSGGQVHVDSAVGHGTTISILLPRSTTGRGMATPMAADDEPHGKGETVLIVEDDADLRELNFDVLERLGYRPLGAGDGASALKMLDDTPEIEVLYTDVVLPGGMSGVDLAEEARHRRPNLKTLFTSGYTDNAVNDLNRIGSDFDLIVKPCHKSVLARKIHVILGRDALRPTVEAGHLIDR